ncbi:MAG: hypothetical protein ACD_2C00174G0005 [uncultured bacterium (gcode 4)]|uniref:Uncharacterized protein n=1 Tax=uncultured bacterium (gcode 4) TaxID=1234023 RepID=K2G2L5_9BACT|nr:MAG: hypothetical protein ACD_2C00174G0005 [uncultured bacterium (gcode 4)]
MKKFILALAILLNTVPAFAATKDVNLSPGWNVFSTPYQLSRISYSNTDWSWLFFFRMNNWSWEQIRSNINSIKPLEWYAVLNSNRGDVRMHLEFHDSSSLYSITQYLTSWWNLIWMIPIQNPIGSIWNEAISSIDFTKSQSLNNLSNKVNSSYDWNIQNANLSTPELWESYWIYMQNPWYYWWDQGTSSWNGTVNIGNPDNNSNQLLLAWSRNQSILSFRVSALNDNITLSDIRFTGTHLSSLYNIRLVDSNWNVVGTASRLSDTSWAFENLDVSSFSSVQKDTSKILFVMADVNDKTSITGLKMILKISDSHIRWSNWRIINLSWSDVVSWVHSITQTIAAINKALNPNKELTTSALRFTVTAPPSWNGVIMNSIDVSALLSGYIWNATVKVYKNLISQSTLAWAGNIWSNQKILLWGNNSTDPGNTNTFIITVEGAILNPNSSMSEWIVRLEDVVIWGISTRAYSNIAQLPISEVK